MLDRLPEYIDPLLLAEKGRVLKGRFSLSVMGRLKESLADDRGYVEVDLRFGKEGKIAAVRGRVQAELVLVCQNCLGPISLPVTCEVNLGLVASLDEAGLLPEPYEPLVVGAGQTTLKDLVEDELLLALPTIPKHRENCLESLPTTSGDRVERGNEAKENPFSILTQLKLTGEK